jgi:hypothetical protein
LVFGFDSSFDSFAISNYPREVVISLDVQLNKCHLEILVDRNSLS